MSDANPNDQAATDTQTTAQGWQAILCVEGVRTGDGRIIQPGATTWRDLPLTLSCQMASMPGHDGAMIGGRIDTIERQGNLIVATGTWDSGDVGQECARLVGEQTLRGVSIDASDATSELVEIVATDPYDEYPEPCGPSTFLEIFSAIEIGGATVCSLPAFAGAVIVNDGMTLPEPTEPDSEGQIMIPIPGMAAAGVPVSPPAAWFADPHLDGPTPFTVLDDGRVFGHAATWGTAHTGYPDRTVTPPRSRSQYAYFRTGTIQAMTADGTVGLPIGPITMATGHAPLAAGHHAAAAHYDDTGTAVADVAVGEDDWGIWVAGALRPGVTDEQIRALRASSLSGDWRTVGGGLELVALLAVNVPGFPIPHPASALALAASAVLPAGVLTAAATPTRAGQRNGEQVSLVAAGLVNPDRHGEVIRILQGEIAALRKVVEPLMPLAVEHMAASIAAT